MTAARTTRKAGARRNLFGFLTKKHVTYQRDVKSERAELIRQAKADKAKQIRQGREAQARDRAELRRESLALKKLEVAERKRKLERKRADAVDRKIEREMREKGYRNPATRRNSADAAAAVSEAWHGRPAKTATKYDETLRYHGKLADLAGMVRLEILVSPTRVQKIDFQRNVRLGTNPGRTQLYLVGGDQSIDLKVFSITGHEAKKELVPIGPVYAITYWTAKQHLGRADKKAGPYRHVFAEHGQQAPILLYDTLNRTQLLAGGSYHIDLDMDFGKHSAGIRD